MAHDEIQALANVTAAPMTLEHKLGTLQQQRRLRGVFLGCKRRFIAITLWYQISTKRQLPGKWLPRMQGP
jgi:hypothetical protein